MRSDGGSFPQVGVSAVLLATVSGVLSVTELWGDEWDILTLSLQVRLAGSAGPVPGSTDGPGLALPRFGRTD